MYNNDCVYIKYINSMFFLCINYRKDVKVKFILENLSQFCSHIHNLLTNYRNLCL